MRSPEPWTPTERHCFSGLFSSRATGIVTALLALAVAVPTLTHAREGVDCLDTEVALSYWRPIRERAATAELPADELAIELVACLGSPDPELRDRIGYELFTYWLRQDKLTDNTRRALLARLSAQMGEPSTEATLARSFSALILAEIMRSDASDPFMTATGRAALLGQAMAALQRENDFRGLDAEIGWIHPVAHLADLLWRFALHPGTSAEQAESILLAVGSKVAPTNVFYTFNEGDRLARVVATLIQGELLTAEKAAAWLASFETPVSMKAWSDAFRSPAGMAELHNTKQFLRALADQLAAAGTDPGIAAQVDALVQGFTRLI